MGEDISLGPVFYAVNMVSWLVICVKSVDEKDAHYLMVACAL